MISLARANLIHDWRRHATAIVVLVLAGLLMTIQLGLVLGFAEASGELKRQLRADIVVTPKSPPRGRAFGFGAFNRIDPRFEGLIWMHPDVAEVQEYREGFASATWYRDDGTRTRVRINTLDPGETSMTYPARFPDVLRPVLATPGAIVLPRSSARSLGVAVGDTAELGNIKVIVGGIVNALPGGGFGTPVFVSAQTARLVSSAGPGQFVSSYLVRLKHQKETDRVIDELNAMLRRANLQAARPRELASSAGVGELLTTTFGWILMGSAVFGLIVGCGIASQTLRGAFLAQLKEFGSLRALGVGRGRMALVALEQAWWTGLASIPIAIFLAFVVRAAARQFDITIALPTNLIVGSSVLLLAVALFAGFISLTAVNKVEPAELLR